MTAFGASFSLRTSRDHLQAVRAGHDDIDEHDIRDITVAYDLEASSWNQRS